MKAMMVLHFLMLLMPFERTAFKTHSIRDFLIYIPHHSKGFKSSDGLSTSGFENYSR
jgi:hypothetical protein